MSTLIRLLITALVLLDSAALAQAPSEQEEWLPLFNGRDLSGWTPKITKSALGENYANTFRVEDGVIKVDYSKYERFDGRFAHLFYAQPFNYYRLRLQYRFVGEPVAGGPGPWAVRNSGVMLHSQAPETMRVDQPFPISIEAQFLGGLGDGKSRPTLNACTPGTEIVYQGSIYPNHCLPSQSKTYDGDQWVRVEVVVLGSGLITHFVNGEKVLEYTLPQVGGGSIALFDPAAKPDGRLLEGGYIALQGESTPVEFRDIQLLNLAGCMDPKAANYKKYFVKSQPETCRAR